MNRTTLLIGLLVLVGLLLLSSVFTVHQTQQALILQFGDVKRVVREPGLHFKLPFIQNVVSIDKRILDLDQPEQEVIAADQKRLVVDVFARFRITDPLEFYRSVNNQFQARARLDSMLDSAMRGVLGEASFASMLSEERADLMAKIRDEVNREAQRLGIDVVDVRIRRADLPEANSDAIYARMQTEREREANEFRALGEEQSRRIKASADREKTVLLAEAQREAEIIRGEGDAERVRIFAEAFNRDPEFFAFYRTMKAYEQALGGDDTTMVLSPESEFFRYFGDFNAPKPAGQ